MKKPKIDPSKYMDFLIEQLTPYKDINVRAEWLWNKDKSYILALANRWLLFWCFKTAVPFYGFLFRLIFIPRLLAWFAKKMYIFGAKQFSLLGNLAYTLDPRIPFGPFLHWDIIEKTYSHEESMWNIGNTSFFFDAITNTVVDMIKVAVKQWNKITHDNKVL